jgi:hypothetical protein
MVRFLFFSPINVGISWEYVISVDIDIDEKNLTLTIATQK